MCSHCEVSCSRISLVLEETYCSKSRIPIFCVSLQVLEARTGAQLRIAHERLKQTENKLRDRVSPGRGLICSFSV